MAAVIPNIHVTATRWILGNCGRGEEERRRLRALENIERQTQEELQMDEWARELDGQAQTKS